MKKVRLITDGACKGNPGPGGWGLILSCGPHRKEVWGSEPHTTNNRMELTAAVRGLEALTETCDVEVVTDSEYVKNGITKWIKKWKLNGWQTTAQKPVVNQDLWQALDRENARHRTKWTWTKGHAADAENIRADELASTAASTQSSGSQAQAAE